MYKPSCVLTLGIEDDYPQLGRVENIYITNDNTINFHVRIMNTVTYNVHRHLYVVTLTTNYMTVTISSLYSIFPLYLRSVTIDRSVHFCIIPKYHILNTLQQ